jgi:hypothetical protein
VKLDESCRVVHYGLRESAHHGLDAQGCNFVNVSALAISRIFPAGIPHSIQGMRPDIDGQRSATPSTTWAGAPVLTPGRLRFRVLAQVCGGFRSRGPRARPSNVCARQ